jgi:hypothetical protein
LQKSNQSPEKFISIQKFLFSIKFPKKNFKLFPEDLFFTQLTDYNQTFLKGGLSRVKIWLAFLAL